jgi:hypothetical protein
MTVFVDPLDAILPIVIQFLDQFPHALDVIVGCARKTEVALWEHLFSIVGNPQDLFEVNPVKCMHMVVMRLGN